MLINTPREAEKYSEHPVQAYDPFYTRDTFLFNCWWNDFSQFLREIVASNQDSHSVNWATNLYYDAILKCKAYEKVTGISLLSLHVPGSPLNSFFDVL